MAIEGIDGAGKTTQAERLTTLLSAAGLDVVRTKEPTDGTWGRKLRESAQSGRLSAEEELAYFIKDRQEHVQKLLVPALAEGKIVIVDRYYFSTVAYQGARGLDPAELLRMNEAFAPLPDLLVIIDVAPKVGIRRIQERGDKGNHFEEEGNLNAVAKVFGEMDFNYLFRVDGEREVDDVTLSILDRLYSGLLSTRSIVSGGVRLLKGRDAMSNDDLWRRLIAPIHSSKRPAPGGVN
ncbi:dTMP kinase [Myxococcus sp. MISCRS1]|uniref:dTMP kinase n=1 Tax=Myxococcus sp. MISCRS1 TaxID=2996786 RepID=UPI002271632A|nr:dTMP kinase [Myxococcus sp. MISCRS1]MCY1000161.1 dTMP kinase [Myxococcus sp. MISCRS1]